MTVLLNDTPYANGEEDPLESLKDAIAFSVDDWSSSRAMAWVCGIVQGWDDASDEGNTVVEDLARVHRWPPETVARLRRLHLAFDGLALAKREGKE